MLGETITPEEALEIIKGAPATLFEQYVGIVVLVIIGISIALWLGKMLKEIMLEAVIPKLRRTKLGSWYDQMTYVPYKGAHRGWWYRLPWNKGKM